MTDPQWLHLDENVMWLGPNYHDAIIIWKRDDGTVAVVGRDGNGDRVGYPVEREMLVAWLEGRDRELAVLAPESEKRTR